MLAGPTRISAVIPAYNAAQFVGEAIASCLHQTVPPVEIIVVDDGSTDETAEIAASFGSLVRVVSQLNAGEGAARNRGISESAGEWVAFLDADDLWEPTKLEQQLSAVQATGAIASHTCFVNFGATQGLADPGEIPADDAIRRSGFCFTRRCFLHRSWFAASCRFGSRSGPTPQWM